MKLNFTHLLATSLLLIACACPSQTWGQFHLGQHPANEAREQDRERTKDPQLGRPAPERLLPVLAQIQQKKLKKSTPGDSTTPWTERGPYNVGGRTRAIMFDPNDASNKKVWAGGVTGGLWYNKDITSATSEWQAVDNFWANLAITCLASDPNNSSTFYAGTGESFADASRGAGIWKSTDGGQTWSQLSATSGFFYVNDIVVRNENGSSAVYAAVTGSNYAGQTHGETQTGLQRSVDGGSTWNQVLPNISGESAPAAAADLEIGSNDTLWVGTDAHPGGFGGGRIYKSGDGTSYTEVYNASVSSGHGRVELACAPSDADYIYAIIEDANAVENLLRTTDASTTWDTLSKPEDADVDIPDGDFSDGQARYNLVAAVNPSDKDEVIVGGVDLFRTTDGGSNWNQISKWSNANDLSSLNCALVRADQHQVVFRPGHPNEAVFGNDGGVYYCNDLSTASSTNTIQKRNNAYNVTQFYTAAIHPAEGENVYLAGARDNGTQLFNKAGMGTTAKVTAGDGGFCFIDTDEPETMIASSINNEYYISHNGGERFSTFIPNPTGPGSLPNPAAYDSRQNVLYYADGDFIHIARVDSIPSTIDLEHTASFLEVSPHTTASTTLFAGTEGGKVFKVTDAGGSANFIEIGQPGSGSISCIEVGGSEDTLALTHFNYGVVSIWYTTDGGSTWINKEGDLPDMPVRGFLFNPNNHDEAIVATELGVWSTSNFTDSSPNWEPGNSGLANVRVDMLRMRESDKQVIAATHGRGLFSSDAFADKPPLADFRANTERAGIEMPVKFTDYSSANPSSWSWSFTPNDVVYLQGTNANSRNPVVQFTRAGAYKVSLTSSNSFGSDTETKSSYISIDTAHSVPYSQNFDSFTHCSSASDCSEICTLEDDWLNAGSEWDDTDWLTENGNPSPSTTGPSGDYPSGTGNYLYTETTGCYNKEVMLYSPVFDLRNATNPSLNFAYHMYGENVNQLELSVYNQGEWELLWNRQGNAGDNWLTETLDLSAYSGKQLVFRFTGYTGDDVESQIALDDFSISESIIRWDGGGSTDNWSEAENWSTNEVPAEGASVVLDTTYVTGDYSINITAPRQVASLTLDAGSNTITLSGGNPLNVTAVVYPESGTLASNGQLTLKALSEIQYGQIAAGNGQISGDVVNEWYYDGRSGYRHIASPVQCALSEIANDFTRLVLDENSDGSIWGWDPDTSYWNVPANTSDLFDEAFSVFMGTSYGEEFSPLPFVFDASGPINTGNQPQELVYSQGDPDDFVNPNENAGWNFLHNPYPSVLDWNEVVNTGSPDTLLSATVYYWDQSIGTNGAYASYNAYTQTSINGGTGDIAKGQAVWVQLSDSPNAGSTTLQLKDEMRKTTNAPKAKTGFSLSSKIRILAKQDNRSDALYFAHFPGASENYDHQFDHLEMDNGELGFSIHTNPGTRQLAYNCLEQYRYPVPFRVQSASEGNVSLSFSIDADFFGEKPRYIKDLKTGKVHNIAEGSYNFNAEAGSANDFLLMHRKDDDRATPEVSVGTGKGRLVLRFRDYGSFDEARLFDLTGKLILREKLNTSFRESELRINKTGVFVLYLTGPDGKFHSQKVIALE